MKPRIEDELFDVIDRASPEPAVHRRERRRRSLKDSIPYVMFIVWVLMQVFDVGSWINNRESKEQEAMKEMSAMREELRAVSQVYVRQDVFNQVLLRIDQQLASINNKLSADR